MEEDGDGEDLTPFWIQSNSNLHRGDRLRRGVSSFFFSSGLVVFLLLVTAVAFLAFAVPSTLSFSAQIFRPTSVKKSWDSLNIVLVLVAVVFGFLSRNKNEERYGYFDEFQDVHNKENETQKSDKWGNYQTVGGQKSDLSNSREWYEYSDVQASFERKNSFLRRNSCSYPDLREFSVNWDYGDYQRRFSDDFHVDPGRVEDAGRIHRRHRSLEEVESLRPPPPQPKTVIVDTLVSKSKDFRNLPPPAAAPPPPPAATLPPPSPPPPPPPPEPSPPVVEIPKVRTKKERSRRKPGDNSERTKPISRPASATAPPPPPPPPPQKSSKSDRKRGGATGSATKDFLNSLYHKKKKKQRQKSIDNLDSLLHESQPPLSFHLPPPHSPPRPPSSPPPSVLQNLFSSKKQKRKRTIKVTVAHATSSPSPSDPNPNSQNAPNPIKLRNFEKLEETSNSGGESPLNRIPPPPPPPPPAFSKNPAWKFVVQGDYVRVNSTASSRSGSPDPDELDSDVTPSAADGGDITPFHPSPLFCASPDVNTKAESFITNFRAKLKLEKIHSMKKRDPGLSTLGPRQA